MPCAQAIRMTAVRAFGHAPRLGDAGEQPFFPSFGTRSPTVPARVSRSLPRYPLRCPRRAGSFPPHAAPVTAPISGSISRSAAKPVISRSRRESGPSPPDRGRSSCRRLSADPGSGLCQQPDPSGKSPVTTSARTRTTPQDGIIPESSKGPQPASGTATFRGKDGRISLARHASSWYVWPVSGNRVCRSPAAPEAAQPLNAAAAERFGDRRSGLSPGDAALGALLTALSLK